jgi:hypothetical protein
MDYTNRHHWKHPRTSRDAFGGEYKPLRKSLTFHPHNHGGLVSVVVVVLLIALIMVMK